MVVTAYNIEEYLPDCLQSIAEQSYPHLDVLVVDDGSTDRSAEIARELAAGDERFRVLTQANAGLGEARNAGAAATSGEFLMFVDGDDILPHRALEKLIGALRASGSDFATGNVLRFGEAGEARQSPMLEAAFKTSAQATHVSRQPTLLADRIIPNKLWRRTFWDAHRFRFPAGVLHEDIGVAIPAHVMATAVDVVAEPCYLYRRRESGDSITQRRLEPRTIRDRHSAVLGTSQFLRDRGETKLKRRYDELCAAQDFRYTLQLLDEADEEFRALFLDLVNDFFDTASRDVFAPLPAIDRLKWHLVRRRLMPELLEVLRFEKSGEIHQHRHVRRGRKVLGDYPFRDDPRLAVPDDVYRVDRELTLRGRVDDVWWEGDRLWLSGYAYLRHIDLPGVDAGRIRLRLEQGTRGPVLDLPVTRVSRPDVTAADKVGLYDYQGSGFRTSVPAGELHAWDGSWRPSTWQLWATVRSGGLERSKRISETAPGRAGRPDSHLVDGVRIVPTTVTGRFGVLIDVLGAVVHSWRVCDGVLDVEGSVTADVVVRPEARLLLVRASDSTTVELPVALTRGSAPGTWTFTGRVPLQAMIDELDLGDVRSMVEEQGQGVAWQLLIRTSLADRPRRLSAADTLTELTVDVLGHEIVVTRDRQWLSTLFERVHRPVATTVRAVGAGCFELTGSYRDPDPKPRELVLHATDRVEELRFPLRRSGEDFTAAFDGAAVRTLAGQLPLAEGTWSLLVRPADGSSHGVPVTLSAEAAAALPLSAPAGAKGFRLTDVDGALLLEVGPDLLADEVGRFNQRRLREIEAPAFARRGLRDVVLFESYGGKQFADNPRAIAEELLRRDTGLELTWSVEDGQTEVPAGIQPVRRGSRDWYEAQARARYVVTCVYRSLQHPWDLSPDQVVLQTWHGAPLKRVGFDSDWIEERASRDYHARLRAETGGWTHLISPSRAATPILRSAFRYDGDVLETGYPRTDVFFRPDREVVAEQVRQRIGLPAGKKVVLYAPTFRDHQQYSRNRFRLDLALDVRAAAARLGDGHVLLVRRHAKVVDSPLLGAAPRFAYDVSAYPDVNELLLVTDVLVTDYSSLMFDFANTGRPMIFYGYDLAAYTAMRAFYFDLPGIVPGPMVATSAEAIEAVAAADEHRAAVDERYRAFTERFCGLDDGAASARVVDAVFR